MLVLSNSEYQRTRCEERSFHMIDTIFNAITCVRFFTGSTEFYKGWLKDGQLDYDLNTALCWNYRYVLVLVWPRPVVGLRVYSALTFV